jgi:deazaflavin-dependent oxidoreductase (nitroreductase family)
MSRLTKAFWRFAQRKPRVIFQTAFAHGQGPDFVLLLTTTGRKSGLPRVTPLQYEEVDGLFYVAAARGQQADWFRNIQANPAVEVRLKDRQFRGLGQPVTDPARIADFLQVRFQRHPFMLGAMFLAQGWSPRPNRAQLEQYATHRAMVIIRPDEPSKDSSEK